MWRHRLKVLQTHRGRLALSFPKQMVLLACHWGLLLSCYGCLVLLTYCGGIMLTCSS